MFKVFDSKCLFLDIDGVLNSWWSVDLEDYNVFHEVGRSHIMCLNEIVYRTGTMVVITSAKRLYYSIDSMLEMFLKKGFEYPSKVIGATPLDKTGRKGLEIRRWVKANHWNGRMCILDDSIYVAPFKQFLVKTNNERGLQPEHVSTCIEMLGRI